MKIGNASPTFEMEKLLWQEGIKFVAGVDEVGRGCFAGPIVASAVILPPNFSAAKRINDSKLLSPARRKELSEIIKQEAVSYALGVVSINYINKYGIGQANQLAFKKSLNKLSIIPEYVLVDGFKIKKFFRTRQKAIIKGDRISVTIASASIIAKVYRDELMQNLPYKYNKYGFYGNKGYGTEFHREAIYKYGLSDLHRTSFNLQKFLQ